MALKKKPAKATTKRVKKAEPVKAAKPDNNVEGLNERQKRFCEEYVIDLNAKRAYLRAGYQCTEAAAEVSAHHLLSHPKVSVYVAELQAKRSQRTEITQDRVLKELAEIAFIDISGAFNDDGSLKAISEIPENIRRSIAGIEVVEMQGGMKIGGEDGVAVQHVPMYTKKIKVIEKTKALELIGRHLKMFTDKVEHGIPADDPLMKLLATIAESKNTRITA